MKYLVLLYDREDTWAALTEAQQQEVVGKHMAFGEAAQKAGVFVTGEALKPVATATTVRVRHGKVTHTDGPFAETKEALGGFYLLDVPTLDDALGWAAKLPEAASGSVEVRPVQVY